MNGRKLKVGVSEDPDNWHAGAVSSQFEPIAADGNNESCSNQANDEVDAQHVTLDRIE